MIGLAGLPYSGKVALFKGAEYKFSNWYSKPGHWILLVVPIWLTMLATAIWYIDKYNLTMDVGITWIGSTLARVTCLVS